MSIYKFAGAFFHLLFTPFYSLGATRPRRESWKSLLFAFPLTKFLLKKKWAEWKEARIWINSKQKNRLFGCYPLFVKKQYIISYPTQDPNITEKQSETFSEKECAIVVHVYYVDVFEKIVQSLQKSNSEIFSLYVTHCPEVKHEIVEVLQRYHIKAYLHEFENRGRDIRPFLLILPVLQRDGIQFVLKLQTKKSLHLGLANSPWLSDILTQLIENHSLSNHFKYLHDSKNAGMIAPAGHVLPLALYYGKNTQTLVSCMRNWEVDPRLAGEAVFVAGSMFFIRIQALESMLIQDINTLIFEDELGQTDGTMAHAVERLFALVCQSNDFLIVDTAGTNSSPSCRVFSDHRFSR